MDNEQRKKQLTQVIILVALLGVMLALVFIVLLPSLQPKKKPTTKKTVAAGEQAQAGKASGSKTTATDMPKVAGAGKASGGGVEAAPGVENVGGVPTGFNPNLFQVFDLAVPRNPFVQQEAWYADNLKEQIPGYPQLRESGYFESMEPYLPDITGIFGEHDWNSVQIQRGQTSAYSLSGTSEDGRIETSVSLSENIPTQSSYTWTKDSGIPLSALSSPDFLANLDTTGAGVSGGMGAVPSNGDLFQEPDALPNMDDYLAAGGGSVDQLGPNGALLGMGDQLTCRGVNLTQGAASALLDFNGAPFLVRTGDVLPTHYEVLDIKEDGVMIQELRDGSTQWLPLTLLMEPAASTRQGKK